jgi:hypothetical protein
MEVKNENSLQENPGICIKTTGNLLEKAGYNLNPIANNSSA